jgi:hypothetical protein
MSRVVVAAAVLGAVGAAILVASHADETVYAIPGWGVTIAVGLAAVSLAGCAVIAWSRNAGVGALMLGAAATGAFGLLAIASVGLLILLAATGLLVFAIRAAATDPQGGRALAGGALAGLPLALLAVMALSGPVVECAENGAGAGENIFMTMASVGGDGVSTGESTSSAAVDTSGGEASGASYEYSYKCAGGKLVDFDLRWR